MGVTKSRKTDSHPFVLGDTYRKVLVSLSSELTLLSLNYLIEPSSGSLNVQTTQ